MTSTDSNSNDSARALGREISERIAKCVETAQKTGTPTGDDEIFGLQIKALKALGFGPAALGGLTGISPAVLDAVFGMSSNEEFAQLLAQGKITFRQFFSFNTTCTRLLAPLVAEPDQLLASLINELEGLYHVPLETLTNYSGVPKEAIDAYRTEPASLPDSDKYRLAIAVLTVVSVFGYEPRNHPDWDALEKAQQAL
jgi:hypothetical protein